MEAMTYDLSSKSISIKNFNQICRTCLGEDKLGPICSMVVENIKAVELLQYTIVLSVNKSDSLPQNICENCLKELYHIYEFKKQVEDNQTALQLLIEHSTQDKVVLKNSNNLEEEFACNLTLIEDDIEYKCEENDYCENETDVTEEETIFVKQEQSNTLRSKRLCRRQKVRPPFKCSHCPKIFESNKEFQEHKSKYGEMRNHQCGVCQKKFTSSKLKQHMRVHTKEKPYQCNVCLQRFSMSGNLRRHQMTHTGERPHVCKICGKGFIQATSLHSHEKTHINDDKSIRNGPEDPRFSCQYCGRSFKRATPFNVHIKKHNENQPIKSCGNKKESSDNEELREHICDVCAKGFKTKHLLKAHRLTHGEKSYLCSECGKGFVTKASLQSHLKIHTGEKPHTCVVCNKSFAHVGSFDSHMLIHSGVRPYTCKHCPKTFTQLSHLTYHLRTHSGERPYSCSYCGKTFALKGNLTVHVRTHTGETPFICQCGKGFYDSSSLKKHKKNHTKMELVKTKQVEIITQDTASNN